MATANVKVSPMNKISLIGIWMETVIYGFNCVVFGLCMFFLFRGGRTAPRRWALILTSTLLFLLCTVHVAASLRQLLEAFVWAPTDVPDYSTLYWLNTAAPLNVLKEVLYDTLVFFQDLVLIWRFYVVFDRKWRYVIFFILLEATRTVAAYWATAIYTLDPGIDLYDSIVSHLGFTALALDITVNILLTVAIAVRLWRMSRAVAPYILPMENRYLATMYVIIESGGLFTGATIIMLGLYASRSPVTLTGLDITSQLAVLTPLLIVVRVELGLTHSLEREHEMVATFRTTRPEPRASNPRVHISVVRKTEHQVALTGFTSTSHSLASDMKV